MGFLDRLFCPNRWTRKGEMDYQRDMKRYAELHKRVFSKDLGEDEYLKLMSEMVEIEFKWVA